MCGIPLDKKRTWSKMHCKSRQPWKSWPTKSMSPFGVKIGKNSCLSVSPQTLCMSLGYIDRGKIVMNGANFLHLFCGSIERFTETPPEIIFSLLFSFHGKLMSVGLSIPWHPFSPVLYRKAGSLWNRVEASYGMRRTGEELLVFTWRH